MALNRIEEFMLDQSIREKIQGVTKPIAQTFTATSGQTVFNLSNSYEVGKNLVSVEIDGVPQNLGEGFTETSTTSITLSESVPIGSKVKVIVYSTYTSVDSRINDFGLQLADITKNILNKMDVFTTVNGTKCLDGTKVSVILNDPANMFQTFYLKSGSYSLVNPITITHEVSLFMDDDTIITAYQAMDCMFYYSLGLDVTGNAKRKVIHGGKWDGNGLAVTCLRFNITANLTLENMQISNPIAYGIDVQAGYELIANNLLFHNNLTTNIEAVVGGSTIGCTAMRVNTFDGVYNDISIVNYTVGIECIKTANYFSTVHMWGNQLARLSSTYNAGIIDRGGYNFFDKVYFDTFNLGYYATSAITAGNSHLSNCMFSYADSYYAGRVPIYISNQSTKPIVLKDCGFRYDRTSGTNTAQLSTGNIDLLQYRDCDFATPATLTNIPTNNFNPKVYKFRLNFTGLAAITAGNGVNVEKDLTLAPYYFSNLAYDDTVIINPTLTSWGIHIQPYVNNNMIGLRLQNTTTGTVTPTNITAYVTIIKNYDKTVLPYIS